MAWNPCEPIHYVVNPDGAPDDWEGLVDDGIVFQTNTFVSGYRAIPVTFS